MLLSSNVKANVSEPVKERLIAFLLSPAPKVNVESDLSSVLNTAKSLFKYSTFTLVIAPISIELPT